MRQDAGPMKTSSYKADQLGAEEEHRGWASNPGAASEQGRDFRAVLSGTQEANFAQLSLFQADATCRFVWGFL